MSVVTLKGKQGEQIPRNTYYNLVAHGATKRDGVRQIETGECTKSLSKDLDPGYYKVVFKKTNEVDQRIVDYYHIEDFYVDVDEAGFKKLSGIKAKFFKPIMTSDGPRWNCQMSGCQETVMTEYAAVVHEASHSGFDLTQRAELDRYLGIAPKPAPEPPAPKVPRT